MPASVQNLQGQAAILSVAYIGVAHIADDNQKPGPESVGMAEISEGKVGSHNGFLHQLTGNVGVLYDAHRDGMGQRLVALRKLSERLPVAVARRGHELGIREFYHRSFLSGNRAHMVTEPLYRRGGNGGKGCEAFEKSE